jgi:CO/xanthine dehydrogenase Mo-binding subunit
MSRYTGVSLPRAEDSRLLTGTGCFGDDVLPNALHAVFVRSERAHARLAGIDVARAAAQPGVRAVATFDDLPPKLRACLPVLFPHEGLTAPRTPPPLAADEVCYVGQPVAVVVAEDRYLAEDAAELVDVTYEDLPVVTEYATAPDAAVTAHVDLPTNVAATVSESTGDVEAAMRTAEHCFEWTFTVERSAGMPIEGRVVSARYTEGSLEVRDTTQSPVSIRDGLADLLGLDTADVRVVTGDIGGSFGSKGVYFYAEEIVVPWLAIRLGEAVKWTEDRAEHFVASAHERGQQHRVRVGVDGLGRIVALHTSFVHDMGAYAQYGLIVPVVTASQLPSLYRLPCYSYEFRAVYTNTVPVAPYRGAGRPHGVFVMERVLDKVARQLGIDPVTVRRRNLIGADEFPYAVGVTYQDGERTVYDSGDYPRLFDRLDDAVGLDATRDWCAAQRRDGRWVGLGMAGYVEGTGLGPYEFASVTVDPDGGVVVATALSSQGQGHETMLAQLVADELAVPVESVRVRTGDSRRVPFGTGTYASRAAVMAGNAARTAAVQVRARAIELAARALDVPADALRCEDGTVFAPAYPGHKLTLGELALMADPARFAVGPDANRIAALRAQAHRGTGGAVAAGELPVLSAVASFSSNRGAWGSGVHAVVVEVDRDTFTVRILRYVVVHDCGTVINPAIVAGQIRGGVAQGIGGALFEKFGFAADGTPTNANLHDFLLPTAPDVPPVEIHHCGVPAATNPLGIKGVGEAGVIPVGAAIANAVEDATGLPIDDLPVFPAHLYRLAVEHGTRPDQSRRHGGDDEDRHGNDGHPRDGHRPGVPGGAVHPAHR